MHSGIQTPKPGWSGLQYQCWYQCIYQGMTNIPDQHWFIPTRYKAKMSLEPNTRTWYESSRKDPIPRAGWYEDFYNTQYQNQGGEFKSWIPDGCDLVPPTLTMAMVQMKLLNLLPMFFFWYRAGNSLKSSLPWQPVQSSKCKTVGKPLVLTSDHKKERKSKRAFERFLTVNSNPKWRINSFTFLGSAAELWCHSFILLLSYKGHVHNKRDLTCI